MEGAADGKGEGSFRTFCLGDIACFRQCFGVTRDDDLAGGVVVRYPSVAFTFLACLFYQFAVQTKNGIHGAVVFAGGHLHSFASFGNQAASIGERNDTGCYEGAVFAQ